MRAARMEEGVEKDWEGRSGSRRWEKREVECEEGIVLSLMAWRMRMGARIVCKRVKAGWMG